MIRDTASGKARTRLSPEARRQQLLETARDTFASGGYRISLDDLASATGVTRTLLYHYFPSRLDLFRAVYETELSRLLAQIGPRIANARPTVEGQLRATVEAIFDFAAESPAAWRVLFVHMDDFDSDVLEVQARLRIMALEATAVFVSDDMVATLRTTAGTLAGEVGYQVTATAIQWWLDHPEVPRDEIVDITFNLLWRGIDSVIR